MKYLLLVFLWAAWGALHSLMASRTFTRWSESILGRHYRYYRLIYNALAVATFVPLLAYSETIDTDLVISFSPPWNLVQYGLIALSLAIFLWSLRKFDGLAFLGVRQATAAALVVTDGPYRFTRHPMYLAALILIWSFDATLAGVITSIVLTVYIIIGCILEERKLLAEFGDAYREYQRQVPMLVPLPRFSR